MKKTFLRKITATFLAMVMAVIILPFQAAAEPGGGGWAFDSATGKLTISTDAGTTAWRESIVEKATILSVELTTGVTSIGDSAFLGCTSLATVIFNADSTLTSIGEWAFAGCTSLESIIIPNSVTSMRYAAFSDCKSLASITIPDSVTSIGDSAFAYCTSLETVEFLRNTPPSLGSSVFAGSTAITKCYVPYGKKTAYTTALSGKLPISAEIIERPATSGECGGGLTWEFAGSTLTITGTGAMYDFFTTTDAPWDSHKNSITSVSIGEGVTSIGNYAFYECSRLKSIIIPSSVKSIGQSAFQGCTDLGTVTFDADSKLESIGTNAFNGCSKLSSIIIPSSVTSIGTGAFVSCTDLGTVTFDGSELDSIGSDAFRNCSKLSSIIIPSSVTSIGGGAFMGCTSLGSITIPSSVTSIGDYAFYNCSILETVEFLPNTPPTFGTGVFNGSNAITKCYVPYDTKADYEVALGDMLPYLSEIIERPATSGECGSGLTWEFAGSTLTITFTSGDGTTGAMYNFPNGTAVPWYSHKNSITSVSIGEGVTSIGEHAFYGLTNITSISIPSGVTRIGKAAICDCPNLTSVTIPSSVTEIRPYAFDNCEKLTSVVVDEGNVNFTIGDNGELMSKDKTKLIRYLSGKTNKSYTVPDSVTTIGDTAFSVAKSLESITIPSSVTSIDFYAFWSCPNLKEVEFLGNTPPTFGVDVFFGSAAITKCYVPYGTKTAYTTALTDILPSSAEIVERPLRGIDWILDTDGKLTISSDTGMADWIVNGWYDYRSDVKNVEIGGGVTSIGNYAFRGCTSLETVNFDADSKLESIGQSAFYSCSKLSSITIPSSVTRIGLAAFYECTDLEEVEFLGTTPPTTIGDELFIDVPDGLKIYVPFGTKTAYTSALDGKLPDTAEIIEREKPVIPDPQPSTGGSYAPPQPSVAGGTGWSAVNKSISNATDGSAVAINMNGATELPKSVLDAVKGKNINLVITMTGGFVWTINGKDIIDAKNIDLTIKKPLTQRIPTNVLNTVTGEKFQLYLGFEGDFGFKAVLTVPLGSQFSGRYANLFYFNSATKKLEYISSGKIGSDGKAGLDFTHASDYVITITSEVSKDIKSDSSETDTSSEANPTTGDGAVMIQVISLALIFTSSLFINKKLRRNHQ